MNTRASESGTPARFTALGDANAGVCEGDVCAAPSTGTATEGASWIEFNRVDGSTGTLADYADDVILIVNVASKCGLTPQYEALQNLYADHHDNGFEVLAFPANDFMGQEPGTDAEIADFCSTQYSVTFPVMSRISVTGEDQHPLYAALTTQLPHAEGKAELRDVLRNSGIAPTEDPDVLWNFEKFLISKGGNVVGRFAPATSPDDPELVAAIQRELSKHAGS